MRSDATRALTALALVAACEGTVPVAYSAFTAWYTAEWDGTTETYSIRGHEPNSGTDKPVFIYFSGTDTGPTETAELRFTREMAGRDYVAAWVQYPDYDYYPMTCTDQHDKMAAVRSGIDQVCARAKANCARGLAVMGFSQGAAVATLAKQYRSAVSAALLFGHGVTQTYCNCASCYSSANVLLPRSKRRLLNGQFDHVWGSTDASNYANMKASSGYDW